MVIGITEIFGFHVLIISINVLFVFLFRLISVYLDNVRILFISRRLVLVDIIFFKTGTIDLISVMLFILRIVV